MRPNAGRVRIAASIAAAKRTQRGSVQGGRRTFPLLLTHHRQAGSHGQQCEEDCRPDASVNTAEAEGSGHRVVCKADDQSERQPPKSYIKQTAIIGGDPKRFGPFVELHKRAFGELEKAVQPIGVHSPGYVAKTDEQAREDLWPAYKTMRDRIGAERGWPPMGRAEFDQEADRGSLYVGSPETVARKISATVKALGAARFQMKYSAGALSHEKLMDSIGLYGEQVIPRVRDLLA